MNNDQLSYVMNWSNNLYVFMLGALLLFSGCIGIGDLIGDSDTPPTSTEEGLFVPNLEGKAHMLGSTDWIDYSLYDELQLSWTNDSNSNEKWILIQFMDTDCGYCMNSAEDMTVIHETYGGQLTLISVAVSLSIPNHESSREEVVAFQEKNSLQTCNGGDYDCSERPGEPHNWTYLDDLQGNYLGSWGILGTPSHIILQPDGIVAWNQAQHPGQDVEQAINLLLR
jgi:hypothetical protein